MGRQVLYAAVYCGLLVVQWGVVAAVVLRLVRPAVDWMVGLLPLGTLASGVVTLGVWIGVAVASWGAMRSPVVDRGYDRFLDLVGRVAARVSGHTPPTSVDGAA